MPEPQATIGALIVGARSRSTQDIPRASVHGVFMDGKQLVLLGGATEELAREASDLAAKGLENAFVDHGYPWHAGGDPYHDEYRRWVDGSPGLPDGANALLKTRERALAKGDKGDLAELRAELARLGVVVRDERKRQYWRSTKELDERA